MNIIDVRACYYKYKHNQRHNKETRSFLEYYRDTTKETRIKIFKTFPQKLISNVENYKFIISRENNIYILKNIKNRIFIKMYCGAESDNLTKFKRNTDIIYLSIQGIIYGKKEMNKYSFKEYKGYKRFKNKLITKYAAYFAACERMRHDSLTTLQMFK